MNISKTTTILASLLVSSSTLAVTCPTMGPVTTISGGGLKEFTDLSATFQSVMVIPTQMQVIAAINNAKNTMSDQASQLTQTIIEAKQTETNKMLETDRTASQLQGTYTAELDNFKKSSEIHLIPIDGVKNGPSEAYFAKLCASNKLNKSLWDQNSQALVAQSVAKAEKDLKEATEQKNAMYAAREQQIERIKKYCSPASVQAGQCEEAAQIPNADILAAVAIQPSNDPEKAVLKDVVFKTQYTYSDFERGAAEDYYKNILQMHKLKKPQTIGGEVNDLAVAYYDQLKAAQSLAGFTFHTSMANRTAPESIEGDTAGLSKFDKVRLVLHKTETEDLQAAVMSNEKGRMVYLLNQKTFGNLLKREKSAYQERINNLTAAILSIQQNESDRVSNLISKK
ncbi:hypothetical protein [Vibrio crassostreae]|uniref:hypothetical protein n=1 Tax=Vibrio crassostreae TaxID=246167 RepID=UPI001B303088|nr:hypothetical protein [Vibrio crassostreae]